MVDRTQRRASYILLIGIAVLALGVGAVSADGDAEVSINESNEETASENISAYNIVVSNATDGIRGFEFTISLESNPNAKIVDTSLGKEPEEFDIVEQNISSDGDSVTISAIYLNNSNIYTSNRSTIVAVFVEKKSDAPVQLETNLADNSSPGVGVADKNGMRYTISSETSLYGAYVDQSGVVRAGGLNTAVSNFLNDNISPTLLNSIIKSYLSGNELEALINSS